MAERAVGAAGTVDLSNVQVNLFESALSTTASGRVAFRCGVGRISLSRGMGRSVFNSARGGGGGGGGGGRGLN